MVNNCDHYFWLNWEDHSVIDSLHDDTPHICCRFNIQCITVDGKRHSKGILEGGYRSPSSVSSCADKLCVDACVRHVAKLSASIAAMEELQRHHTKEMQALEKADILLGNKRCHLEDLEAKHKQAKQCLKMLTLAEQQAQQRCDELEGLLRSSELAGDVEPGEDFGVDVHRAEDRAQARLVNLSASLCKHLQEIQVYNCIYTVDYQAIQVKHKNNIAS
jgi:chromosome segregation ATPase